MSVVNLTAWQVRPGRMAETMANAAAAKRIFESLGAKVRVLQPLVAGPVTSHLNFSTTFDTMSAYAAFSTKLQANGEWQLLLNSAILSPEPAATLVANSLSTTIPGLDVSGPVPKGAGPVALLATIHQVLPGKEEDAIAALKELAAILNKLGARFSARTITVGGPATGQVVSLAESDDLAGYAAVMDALPSAEGYQAFHAKRLSSMASVGRSLLVQVL